MSTGSVDTAESWLCEEGINSIDDLSANDLIATGLSGGVRVVIQLATVGARSKLCLYWLAGHHIGTFGERSVIHSGSGVSHREKLGVLGVLAS